MGGKSRFQLGPVAWWKPALLILSLFRSAEAAEPDAFLLPRSTVVILVGLPGDVESEQNYQDQLQGWLQFIATTAAKPDKVRVFWDNPDALSTTGDVPLQVLRSGRAEFLAVAKSLAGRTNPLVVIAWGHGGFQGSKPVFHVRGPRLTPEDFAAFAGAMPRAESRWVLFFRASGRFASQLAAEGRQIISSEHETPFTSDPIGLPATLKIVRTNSTISFRSLADELGRATAVWYEERHLARTEEPTLWLADQPPRLLVAAEKSEALASVPAQKTADTPAAPEPPIKAPDLRTDLPGAWKEIARIDPQAYPDADTVMLRRRRAYTIGSSPALTADSEEFLQVLTLEGKHYGDFDFSFSPPDENLTFLDCEVLRPDGQLVRLDPDEIRDAGEKPVGGYRTERRKFFSLPGVGPGAILHVRYRRTWKTYPFPHVSLAVPLAAEVPVADSTIQVNVPKDSPFHFTSDQIETRDPEIKQTSYGSSYTWRYERLAAHAREALAAPPGEPALLLSTFPNWAAFAEWYARISLLADEVTPEIAAQARELTRDAGTDREKALALYNYVTNLRYVAVPLGVNSFRPHAAANVLKNQFGDCKDKANLFNVMLRAVGIDAHLVLVPRFSQAHDAIPGFAFNHAISRVRVGDQTLWVDTTDDVCRFGMLPPGDPGRKVLVIDGKSTALTQLPLPKPEEHRLTLRAKISCAEANHAPGSIDVTALGYPDYDLRLVAREIKPGQSTRPLLGRRFRPAAGTFALERQSFSAISKLNENFSLHAEGRSIGIISATDGQQRLRAPFWLPREWDGALHRRASPLFLNQGYPLLLDEIIEFTLPASVKSITLPAARANGAPLLRWKLEWAQDATTSITARLQVELANGELSRAETPALQEQLSGLFDALTAEATFTRTP